MTSLWFVLDKDHNVIAEPDQEKAARFFGRLNARQVAEDTFMTDVAEVRVSTVFLGLNHRWSSEEGDPPIIFETMVFGGPHDQYQTRCCTWDEALEMHKVAIKRLNLG